ncbi:MAG TPA: hypothetical protein V6C95_21870 [Coleofasciculaceae cyanobacterium]
MKLTHTTIVTTLLFVGLLGQKVGAIATVPTLTPEQAAQISRDLTSYPDFFQRGREEFEREIQRVYNKQKALAEPPIDIHVDTQEQVNQFPQLQQKDFSIPSQQ